MYRQMFEERVNDLYTRALMPGLAHLYIGEEAVAVGVCEALRRTTTSRARTAATATAWPRAPIPKLMFAELLGKEAGLLQGQGRLDAHCRSRHRQPRRQRHRGGSAGIATGAAFASKYLKRIAWRCASSARARSARVCSTRR
jgi:acetoin:2,6-dichlorophenolindophenol oxidoreductase subunit alpha